jgi:hypothetical protein
MTIRVLSFDFDEGTGPINENYKESVVKVANTVKKLQYHSKSVSALSLFPEYDPSLVNQHQLYVSRYAQLSDFNSLSQKYVELEIKEEPPAKRQRITAEASFNIFSVHSESPESSESSGSYSSPFMFQ